MMTPWNNTHHTTTLAVRPPRQTRHWRGKRMVFRYRLPLAFGSTITVYGL